jgi:hypothetical protein
MVLGSGLSSFQFPDPGVQIAPDLGSTALNCTEFQSLKVESGLVADPDFNTGGLNGNDVLSYSNILL